MKIGWHFCNKKIGDDNKLLHYHYQFPFWARDLILEWLGDFNTSGLLCQACLFVHVLTEQITAKTNTNVLFISGFALTE